MQPPPRLPAPCGSIGTCSVFCSARPNLQFSAAWPLENGEARLVPIDFLHTPTPDQLRQDENVPWQKVEAFAAGKRHEFRVKTMDPVLWRKDRAIIGNLPSTGDLLRLLRYETWAGVLRPATFYHFVSNAPPDTNAQKPMPDLPAILFDAA